MKNYNYSSPKRTDRLWAHPYNFMLNNNNNNNNNNQQQTRHYNP